VLSGIDLFVQTHNCLSRVVVFVAIAIVHSLNHTFRNEIVRMMYDYETYKKFNAEVVSSYTYYLAKHIHTTVILSYCYILS